MPDLAENKLARRDFAITETLEVGLALTGQEVKSIRAGFLKLQGSYATITRGEAWLIGSHLPPYKPAGMPLGYVPDRSRKLLVHNRELIYLSGKIAERGLTLVPIRVYTQRGKLKLELGLGRGHKEYEKRDIIKKRDVDREIRAALKYKRDF